MPAQLRYDGETEILPECGFGVDVDVTIGLNTRVRDADGARVAVGIETMGENVNEGLIVDGGVVCRAPGSPPLIAQVPPKRVVVLYSGREDMYSS